MKVDKIYLLLFFTFWVFCFTVRGNNCTIHPKDSLRIFLDSAQNLSWQDKLYRSKNLYEEILQRWPGNQEAQRNLAQVQSWRGKQRDAQAKLQEYLKENPGDTEAQFLLAQSLSWMGRQDKAMGVLEILLKQDSLHERGQQLRAEIIMNNRPDTKAEAFIIRQSDYLDISSVQIEQNYRFNYNRGLVGGRIQGILYDPQELPVSIQSLRAYIFSRYRFSDNTELNAHFYPDFIRATDGLTHTFYLYDTWLTLWPNDFFRFDISSSRQNFDNIESLLRRITATSVGLSSDLNFDERSKLSLRSKIFFFTDGNEQRWWQAEGQYRLMNNPKVLIGPRYTGMSFALQLDNGYFNPTNFHAFDLVMKHYTSFWERWFYEVSGSYGREWDLPNESKPMGSILLRLERRFGDRFFMEGKFNYFDSRMATSIGFSRTTYSFLMRYIW
jgi:hypothetical protein